MSWLEKSLPISVNFDLKNKNEGGNRAAFSEGWANADLTIDELARIVSNGYAFCAQMSGSRKVANFERSGFVAVDIDGGLSLEDAEQIDIVKTSATLIYTTSSHTNDTHRFRIVFALEEPLTKAAEYRAVLRSLALRVGGDKAATDPARIFYGNSRALGETFDRGLSRVQIRELIDQSFNAPHENGTGFSEKKTNRSLVKLANDQILRTADGHETALKNLDGSTPVFCPFHLDSNPSAFVVARR